MQQPLRHLGIHITRRLIRDEQVGPVDHRTRDRDPLLFAARQCRGTGARAIGEPDPRQHLSHRALHFVVGGAGDPEGQCDIVKG